MTEWEQHAKDYDNICQCCGKPTQEACQDGTCRACHVDVSWEDCTNGTWNARVLVRGGRSREEILKLYPRAVLDNDS